MGERRQRMYFWLGAVTVLLLPDWMSWTALAIGLWLWWQLRRRNG